MKCLNNIIYHKELKCCAKTLGMIPVYCRELKISDAVRISTQEQMLSNFIAALANALIPVFKNLMWKILNYFVLCYIEFSLSYD